MGTLRNLLGSATIAGVSGILARAQLAVFHQTRTADVAARRNDSVMGVPVLAYAAAAVPATMDGAGPWRTLWTIGHSTHTLEAFVALLRHHGIEGVVDVRAFPGSRRHPPHRDGGDACSSSS